MLYTPNKDTFGELSKYETGTVPEYITESLLGFRILSLGRFRTVWVLPRLNKEVNTSTVENLLEESKLPVPD